MTVKTVHSLEAELIRLRESTKDALQQSWEEVESLQQQCAAHLEITNQLENDVIEARRKQEYWHKRCLDAEFKLLQCNKQPSTEKQSLFRTSWNGIKTEKADDHSLSQLSLDEETEMLQEKTVEQSARIDDLEKKLEDRQSAIESLERTIERQLKSMHSLEGEMQCMIETQRLKEKKGKETFRQKENFLNEQILNLQEDTETKDKRIKSLKKKAEGYKNYIEELSSEMETVLKVLQRAERKGINLYKIGR